MKLNKFYNNYDSKVVPLVFHRIVSKKPEYWEDIQEITFEKIVDYIKHQYFISKNNTVGQDKWLITFDDGNVSDYEIAFPILLKKKVRAIFFVIIDKIGKPGYMNWSQILEMKESGMEIGSHSLCHYSMKSLSLSEVDFELRKSKSILEDFLNIQIKSFSYPYGDYTRETNKLASEAGYTSIFTSRHGLFNSKNSLIPRNSINASMNFKNVLKVLKAKPQTLISWWIEDNSKLLLKKYVGLENYKKVRNYIFK